MESKQTKKDELQTFSDALNDFKKAFRTEEHIAFLLRIVTRFVRWLDWIIRKIVHLD